MIPETGHFFLALSLALAALLSVYPLIGAYRQHQQMMNTARPLSYALFASTMISFLCLIYSLINNDFSVVYVANNSNNELPVYYRIAAAWGAHEGSLLLWVVLLSSWTLAVALFSRRMPLEAVARVLSVMGMVSVGFLLFVTLTSNPFERLLPFFPIDGHDLNPLLQDVGLIFHPPLLYMGYVGFSVAFAFAIASLMSGRLDTAWARWSRPWTLAAWIFLTLGIVLGSFWAYYELGWGGWWFWDPVENASLLPWLSGSALLHSLAVSARRGIFRHWTLLLALFTFILSLLGTLVVRSGMLVSVHAFALDAERALPLLILFAALSCGALLLYAWRCDLRPVAARYFPFSRENLMLAALLLFSVITLIVLLGTFYPMLYGLMGWGKISVGAPYFNMSLAPLAVLMLLLIGGAGYLRWKDTPRPGRVALLWLPLVGVAALAVYALGDTSVLAALLAGVAIVGAAMQFKTSRQRGMLLAHAGVALCALGIILSAGRHHEVSVSLAPGQQVELAGYHFRYLDGRQQVKDNYTAEILRVAIEQGEKRIALVYPERRHYTARNQLMIEPGIHWGWIGSWYAVAGEKAQQDRYAMRFYYRQGIQWIWLGGLVMVAGMLWSRWSERRRG